MSTTYLLVHGAWHSGQSWARVVPLLGGAGHRVCTPTLTGYGDKRHLLGPDVGLGTHVDDIVALILAEDLTGVVLVGHSYAGMVISAVAERVPDRIAELVFLDAMVPVDGESGTDVMPVTRTLIDQAADSAEPWRIPPFSLFGVTDPADVAWVRTMLGDQPVRCLTEPVRLVDPVAAAIPRTHIHCVGEEPEGFDRRPVTQGQVWELTAGHDCMITVPEELAALLLKLG
ncbi:alpha/beta fold hydrolase [Actinoplanes derwentensis]|uniref:Alpha/beta hydrolase family protein n=1 Tax=Actinoplanes derwentensis TaxID=113562 RepID=A0A1H1S587_9ACTN|nr:alpha/beta fold hydrolase [Actinoplanes derwentensis]GID89674.1 esterase [Actinoplanes derwentensis]SDS43121.1 Alpha/beta hydrolase family protein [Actinoplanes derwentensis]